MVDDYPEIVAEVEPVVEEPEPVKSGKQGPKPNPVVKVERPTPEPEVVPN